MIVSQDAALADDNVFQLNVLAEFRIGVAYVKLFQLTAILLRVIVPVAQELRVEDQSLTL